MILGLSRVTTAQEASGSYLDELDTVRNYYFWSRANYFV